MHPKFGQHLLTVAHTKGDLREGFSFLVHRLCNLLVSSTALPLPLTPPRCGCIPALLSVLSFFVFPKCPEDQRVPAVLILHEGETVEVLSLTD